VPTVAHGSNGFLTAVEFKLAAELNRRANRLAHYLRQLGVKTDDRVGICIERSLEMVIGLLAILKAGGAYVPLDPTYPVQRLRFMLEDRGALVLLTQGELKQVFHGLAGDLPIIDIDARVSPWGEHPESNPEYTALETRSKQLAYVIYTSGSTGQPKGVLVPHRAVKTDDLIVANSFLCQNPATHMKPIALT
jgi:non-ribosomal peptide synthetase component F